MLAGLGAGLFVNQGDAAQVIKIQRKFEPSMGKPDREQKLAAWSAAIARAKSTARS
jgi:glycerol kinase